MGRSILFTVQPADLVQFDADLVAAKVARGGLTGAESTLAGALGLTETVLLQQLPNVGDVHLVPCMGRIKARQALFLRVVQPSAFDFTDIRQFSYDVLKKSRVLSPEARHVAMTIHGTGFGLGLANAVQAELSGCMEAIRVGKVPPHLERISFVERDEALARQILSHIVKLLPGRTVEADLPEVPAPQDNAPTTAAEPSPTDVYDVFISYKSEDTRHAQEVYEFLRGHGLRVFFSRESLPRLGNDEYHEQIDRAIEGSRHMVVVTTSGANAMSKWVNYEWRLFLGEKLAGRKTGNLLSVIAGGLAIGDLPISLRNREVISCASSELVRLLEYVKGAR